jgi:hypothetical protein
VQPDRNLVHARESSAVAEVLVVQVQPLQVFAETQIRATHSSTRTTLVHMRIAPDREWRLLHRMKALEEDFVISWWWKCVGFVANFSPA